MQRSKLRLLAISIGTSLALLAVPAFAGTTVVSDPAEDALAITDYQVTVGGYDIDLRSVFIDHGTRSLQIVSTFTYTDADSWNNLRLSIDTNLDGVEDYFVLWAKESGVSGVLNAADEVTCRSVGTSEKYGVNGTVTVTVPRTCLGSPNRLAVHVDVFWFGLNTWGEDLSFVDSAPGLFIDDPMSYSSPVSSSNTGTVTSPQAPVLVPRKTRVMARLTKKTQKIGRAPASLRIKISGSATGRVDIADGRKFLKRLSVKAGKAVTFKLPRRLKVGAHRIKVSFVPADKSKFTASSRTVRLRVRR